MVIAVELHEPKGFGRVRMRRVPNASGADLLPFARESIEPGSEVLTDAWGGYNDMTSGLYAHHDEFLRQRQPSPCPDARCPPHRLSAQTLAARNSPRCCKWPAPRLYYLDEYTFRFNRRTSRSRGLLFYRLIQQAVGDNAGVLPPNRQQPGPQHYSGNLPQVDSP